MSLKFLVLCSFSALAIFITFADSKDAIPWAKEIGCFKDEPFFNRALPKLKAERVSSTYQCIKLCREEKQNYAGVAYGQECWCGMDWPPHGRADTCNMICKSGQICGGNMTLTVYKLYPKDWQEGEHIGCFKDTPENNAMPMLRSKYVPHIDVCIELCREEKQNFAGLKNGNECWCGTDSPDKGLSDKCDMKCESGQMCGGNMALNIYQISTSLTNVPRLSVPRDTKEIGCFKDNLYSERALPMLKSKKVLHSYECIKLCREEGQNYAGLGNGGECWCGEDWPNLGRSDNCNMICESGEICGGNFSLTVYKLYPKYWQEAEYLGCLQDKPKDRTMTRHASNVPHIDLCFDICRKAKVKYGGMMNGHECWCGMPDPKYEKTDKCDMKCESGHTCGGNWTLSAYQVVIPFGAKEIGCFKNGPYPKRVMSMSKTKNVINVYQCIKLCKEEGKNYAGLENGGECWCGKDWPNLGRSDNCNTICESGEICGGNFSLTVYKLYTEDWREASYVSCFKDDPENRLLPMLKSKHVPHVDICIELCKQENQAYVGLENGKECWCGKSGSLNGDRILSDKCSMKCESGQKCGGDSALDVYML